MSDDPASKDGLLWKIRRSLIERLRIRWDGMGGMANQQRYEASIQISLMMDELEGWQEAMRKAERDIAQLRAERDEARRSWCIWVADALGGTPQNIAKNENWDCFKVRSDP